MRQSTRTGDPRDRGAARPLIRRTLAPQVSRRGLLRLGAAGATAALLQPLVRADGARAAAPERRRVLVEDIARGPGDLAAGSLDGLATSSRGVEVAQGGAGGRYISPVVDAAAPFTHIGLHWTAEGGDGAEGGALGFEVRWAATGGGWSGWTPVGVEAHAPAPGEVFGALVSADMAGDADGGRATRLQFRVDFDASGGPSPRLSSVTATLLNAKDGPRLAAAAEPSPAAAGAPVLSTGALFTREDWGADESLRFSGGAEIWPRMYVPVKKVVVHHTATSNGYATVEDAMAQVRAIYTYHAVTLGWGDIGYNALIDAFGNVYEGRHGRGAGSTREVLSPGVVAGHVSSHNYGTTGIALLGAFTAPGEGGQQGISPPEAMRTTLAETVAWECARADLDPEAADDFLRFDDGWTRSLLNVCGHRDCVATICPGGYVYDLMPWLRSTVAAALARTSPTVSLTPPAQDTATVGEVGALPFSWSGSSSDFSIVLEGWRRHAPGSEDIDYLAGFDAARYPAWTSSSQTSATFAQLFEAFGSGEIVPGHYTFHVRTTAPEGVSYQADHTLLMVPGGAPAGITLTATPYKVRGLHKVDLAWEGATAEQVEISRDGAVIAVVPNTGSYTDHADGRGQATYTYRVCETGGACSDEVSVSF